MLMYLRKLILATRYVDNLLMVIKVQKDCSVDMML